jgi:4'-phosphopantetheinyl transferase
MEDGVFVGSLPPQSLRAWRIHLEQPEHAVAALSAVLSADERERAERFVFARHRRRFIVTRACLRALLARSTGVAAAAIRFTYGAHGKPAMDTGAAAPLLHFSVSHAADFAVIALAPDLPLGVDIEAVRPGRDVLAIAARSFAAAEARAIATAPEGARELAFFLCWTRKEAFAKARGDGLALALDRYCVSCLPGEAARIIDVDGSAAEARAWSVLDLRPAPGFVGALVLRSAPRPLTLVPLDLDRDVVPWLREG